MSSDPNSQIFNEYIVQGEGTQKQRAEIGRSPSACRMLIACRILPICLKQPVSILRRH